MGELRFTWDSRKATRHRRKHGVAFREAQSVFADEFGLLRADPDHSMEEVRYLLLGMSARIRLLVVAHTVRTDGTEIRLISARRATRAEQRQYMERLR